MSIVAKKILMGSGAVATPSDDEFNRVSFLSHFDGANNGVNNAFDDGSTSNHTITANGNVTQGSFGPFARPDGEWGVSFDGDGDSLTFTNDATMSLDGDYTFELFFNAKAIVLDSQHPNTWLSGTTQLFIHASGRYVSWYAGGADIVKSADNAILTNVWNHIAVVRSGTGSNNTSLYLNGTRVAQTQNTATLGASSGTARIGSYSASGGNFDGQISNLRILKGTALYSGSSITAPTSKLTAITNTKLLTCQSNRFVDNSASSHTVTPAGNAAVTSFGPFLTSSVYDPAVNGGSLYAPTYTDYLRIPNSADFELDANFSVEFWVNLDTDFNNGLSIFIWANNNSQTQLGQGSGNQLYFYRGGQIIQNTSVIAKSGGWNHIALCRSGSVLSYYCNGVRIGTASYTSTVDFSDAYVMTYDPDTNQYGANGYMSDLRILKGSSAYDASQTTLTAPTAPLTAITNTKLLLNMTDGQAFDSAAQNNLTLYGNAKISTGQAKFGDTSMVFDGTGDYVTLPSNSFTPFGTGDFTIECFARFDAINGKGLFQLGASYLPSAVTGPAVFASVATNNPWRIYYGTSEADASVSPSANTWYHVAYVRSSGVTKLYVNGTSVISQNDTTNYTNKFFVIGGGYSSSFLMDGYIDDFRISHMARYTSNFTAPSAPFADQGK